MRTVYRYTEINPKTLTRFEKAGAQLLWDDSDGKGIRLASGRQSVYLFAGQLELIHEA